MKANTIDAKRLIQQAIQLMPGDFNLAEARYHLKAALGLVEHVEQKRQRRDINQRQNEIKAQFQSMGNVTGGTVDLRENLKIIDELIEKEKKVLDEIAARRKSRSAIPDETGDEVITD